ncbi:MAG: TetR/AcrR family transcriptional regulator [Ktedonobacterales bacterium]|nr:TetR/AcrR family transcriptional regulator [Ktedonobacterales bacterium]
MTTPHTSRPLKERQREEREQLILDAAEALLVEKGYHEMAMDEIAARVGIAKGTVYLHFPSKEELLLALTRRDMSNFIATIDQHLAQASTPAAKLAALVAYQLNAVFGSRFQALIAISQNPELRTRFIDQKSQFALQRQQLEERLTRIFEDGKVSGDFAADIPTPVLVSLFETTLAAHRYQQLVTEHHLTVEDLIAQVTRFFFKGVAAETPHERNPQ